MVVTPSILLFSSESNIFGISCLLNLATFINISLASLVRPRDISQDGDSGIALKCTTGSGFRKNANDCLCEKAHLSDNETLIVNNRT